MAKRKKRSPPRSTSPDVARAVPEPSPTTQFPPVDPPRRNPAMLAVSLGLFGAWFAYLIYIAIRSNA